MNDNQKLGLVAFSCLAVMFAIAALGVEEPLLQLGDYSNIGGLAGDGGDNPAMANECSDDIDNDEDKLCDYDGCTAEKGRFRGVMNPDPDCTSLTDNSESS